MLESLEQERERNAALQHALQEQLDAAKKELREVAAATEKAAAEKAATTEKVAAERKQISDLQEQLQAAQQEAASATAHSCAKLSH